ncbi:three-Cys-motif partner protein TcmP [Elusimicrobiota bacterium]
MPDHDKSLEDDGLVTPEIGGWGKQKYQLVKSYAEIFSSSMKGKWDCRVYVDLFAGAGRSRLRETGQVVHTSPMLALSVPDQFDRYVFCEKNSKKLEALRTRVSKEHPDRNVTFLNLDSNISVSKIISEVPRGSHTFKVLSFCFADPYRLKNLHFATIESLARLYIDFLILIPTGMDASRNVEAYYLPEGNSTIDDFLGHPDWRENWGKERGKKSFDVFLTDLYGLKMKELKYHYPGASDTQLIRSLEKNLALYRLAFFSRNKLGSKFWSEVKKYSDPQMKFFE